MTPDELVSKLIDSGRVELRAGELRISAIVSAVRAYGDGARERGGVTIELDVSGPPGAHKPASVDAVAAARRLEARGAFWDALGAPPVQINGRGGVSEALDEAVETATRVRVDDELVRAAAEQGGRGFGFDLKKAIVAAFEAAGMDVEQ